ncbi:MAG: T9SS type A sorting domain-containing protein, partial [Bacteroidetes bacterium]
AFSDDEGGVEKGSVWVLQLGEVLSIEEIDENLGISLFPNPTRNSFSLDRVDGISSIKVYDLYGRLVVKFSDVSDNLFNVSYLPVGEYIIVAAGTEGNLSSFKLIKK